MPGFIINDTPRLGNIDHKAEFHRDHRWRIDNLGVPIGIGGTTTGTFLPRLYAKTLELPSLSFEDELVDGASLKYKFPKRAIWDNITVSFYDVHGLHNVLREWQLATWSPEEGLKIANDFKGSAIFALTNGQGVAEQIYTIVGCYPTKISHSELSAQSSEIKLLHMTYAFDFATIEIFDEAPR